PAGLAAKPTRANTVSANVQKSLCFIVLPPSRLLERCSLVVTSLPQCSLRGGSTSRQLLFEHFLRPGAHGLFGIHERISHSIQRGPRMLCPSFESLQPYLEVGAAEQLRQPRDRSCLGGFNAMSQHRHAGL